MNEVFYNLIEEASNADVIVFDEHFSVGFNTIIYEDGKEILSHFNDKNMSTLVIKDEELFLKKLKEYLSLEFARKRKIPPYLNKTARNIMKYIMMYLFTYATTEDFISPIAYLEKRIAFLKDNTFKEFDDAVSIPLGSSLLNTDLVIGHTTPSMSMETADRIELSIKDKEEGFCFQLPSIYYGIREENGEKVCYLYGIMKPKPVNESNKRTIFLNKIQRLLFKVNSDVVNSEDYNMDGEANIKDVTVSAVFSLNVFISLLQAKNITKIKAVSYLPLPYLSREIAASTNQDETIKQSLKERNQMIQTNMTNKFIRTLRRLCAQNSSLEVVGYPYDHDEFLTLTVSKDKGEIKNSLLEETDTSIKTHFSK